MAAVDFAAVARSFRVAAADFAAVIVAVVVTVEDTAVEVAVVRAGLTGVDHHAVTGAAPRAALTAADHAVRPDAATEVENEAIGVEIAIPDGHRLVPPGGRLQGGLRLGENQAGSNGVAIAVRGAP